MASAIPPDYWDKIRQRPKSWCITGPSQSPKKNVPYEDHSDTNCIWSAWNSFQKPENEWIED